MCIYVRMRFPGGTVVKNLPANAGDAGVLVSISGLGRSPGRASSRIFLPGESQGQRSWRDTVHRITKESDTTEHCTRWAGIAPQRCIRWFRLETWKHNSPYSLQLWVFTSNSKKTDEVPFGILSPKNRSLT